MGQTNLMHDSSHLTAGLVGGSLSMIDESILSFATKLILGVAIGVISGLVQKAFAKYLERNNNG